MPTSQAQLHAIENLKAAQAKASGKRAQQIAFLLAALGTEYSRNRSYLLGSLLGCKSRPVRDCDEDTVALVIALFERGDGALLAPLVELGPRSDGTMSEILGDFYADTLVHNTDAFLHAIQLLSSSTQQRLCGLAGSRDGGGMAPRELSTVRKQLRGIGDELAFRCLRAVERAVDQAKQSSE
jgi:hypothetical protein